MDIFEFLFFSPPNKIIIKILALILCFGILPDSPLLAHGDLHEQIRKISQQIDRDPNNAELFLLRGQLYTQHEDFNDAIKDYQKARSLNKKLIITDLLLAKVFLKNKNAELALKHANVFLKHQPGHLDGLLTRASIYQQLQKEKLAKQDLESVFKSLKNPLPEHYIAIVEATLQADNSNLEEALGWLRKGQAQYGFDIVLKEKEIELLTQNKQYDNALQAIDAILERIQRKERWLFKKGQICEKANQPEQAVAYYNATLEAIQNLPERFQITEIILELEAMTIQNLQNLLK